MRGCGVRHGICVGILDGVMDPSCGSLGESICESIGFAGGDLLVLNYGWAFIQKPFVASKLIEMVTDVLHSENRSQLGGQEFDSRKDTKNPNCDQNKDADAHPAESNEPKDRG